MSALKLISLRLSTELLADIEKMRTTRCRVPPGKRDYFQWLLLQGLDTVKKRRAR